MSWSSWKKAKQIGLSTVIKFFLCSKKTNVKNDSATYLQYVDVEFLLQVCKIMLCTSWAMTNVCVSKCFYSKPNFNVYEELASSMKMLVHREGNQTLWRLSESHKISITFARCLCWLSSEGMNITCWVGCSNWLWNRSSSALHFLMWYGLQCHEHGSPQEMGRSVCLPPLPHWHNTYTVSCSHRLETLSGLKLTWQNWFVVIRTNSLIWLTLWLHLWQRKVKDCTKIFVCREVGAKKLVFVTRASLIILWKETEKSI